MDFKKFAPFAILVAVIAIGVYYYVNTEKEVQKEGITDVESKVTPVPFVDEKNIDSIVEKEDLNQKYNATIKQQANLMVQAFLKKDFEKFSTYTYPKIIELFGGKEKYIQFLEQLMSGPDAPVFLKFSIGEPSKIIDTGNELQVIVPQTSEIQLPDGILVSNSSLIALSEDNGKHWYFIDTSVNGLEKIRSQFTNLSKDLVVPPKEEPIFYKN